MGRDESMCEDVWVDSRSLITCTLALLHLPVILNSVRALGIRDP